MSTEGEILIQVDEEGPRSRKSLQNRSQSLQDRPSLSTTVVEQIRLHSSKEDKLSKFRFKHQPSIIILGIWVWHSRRM